MEETKANAIDSLFERAGDYLDTRIDLFKLKAVDKSSDIFSSIVAMLVVIVVFLLFIILVNIGIALVLGELLGKSYYGFFALAGIYLITGLIFYSMREKWFKTPILNTMIKKFFK